MPGSIDTDHFDDGGWRVKFSMDTLHRLAWSTVQELGHVLNHLSLDKRLPTAFMPVSPSPYLNGGPAEFLSWIIECHDREFKPGPVMECLEGRLPRPVESDAECLRSDDG